MFLVGTPGLKLTLSEFGIETLGVQGPVGFKPVETWKDFDVDKSVKYVVVSFDPDFNHTKLTEAYLYLKENNAEFIVPDSDCYFSVATGRKVSLILIIEYSFIYLFNLKLLDFIMTII